MNILYKIRVGSNLYGLATENSDQDFAGVFIPELIDAVSPFKKKDEDRTDQKISKGSDNKNTNDAIDCIYYSLNKYINLCAENNPTMLETLFADDINIFYKDSIFDELILQHKHKFLTKNVINRFIGYSRSQELKSFIKTENLTSLSNMIKILQETDPYENFYEVAKRNNLVKKEFEKHHSATNVEKYFLINHDEHYDFSANINVKEGLKRLLNIYDCRSYRKEMMERCGYDGKFLSHTVRLLLQGINLLETETMSFPFVGKEKELLINIKTGKLSLKEIEDLTLDYKNKLTSLETNCKFPEKVDYLFFEKQVLELYKRYYYTVFK